jgi:hypothetical protein
VKKGGESQMKEDFKKFKGEPTQTSDGRIRKDQPDGSTVIERSPKESTDTPTIEIQPPENAYGKRPRNRVKIRYE